MPNLLAFNVGVEIGQFLALAAILIAMGYWRRTDSFRRHAYTANVAMMTAGFVLIGYQLTGYFVALNLIKEGHADVQHRHPLPRRAPDLGQLSAPPLIAAASPRCSSSRSSCRPSTGSTPPASGGLGLDRDGRDQGASSPRRPSADRLWTRPARRRHAPAPDQSSSLLGHLVARLSCGGRGQTGGGWFWRNRGKADVTVTLRTNGDYTEIKRVL